MFLFADNVIILNAKNALLGFPNKISDDPVLSLVLQNKDEYPFAEERRLFYVAMTRAKQTLVISYAKEKNGKTAEPSRFVNELFVVS